MKFYKINNLTDLFGQPNYRGLDIERFIPGSQAYTSDLGTCVIATKQVDFGGHADVSELTQEQYLTEKQAIFDAYPKPKNLEEIIGNQQTQIDQLTIMLGDVLLNGGM